VDDARIQGGDAAQIAFDPHAPPPSTAPGPGELGGMPLGVHCPPGQLATQATVPHQAVLGG
jgi:hypothetical protein